MITKITTNKIKAGSRDAYLTASKAFEAALVERTGCLSAKTYAVEGDETLVVNIETWPDMESASTAHKTDVFQEYLPLLMPYFVSNEDIFLTEA